MNEPHLPVSEEDLILHYYGEHLDEAPIERHLAACGLCREEFGRLSQVLALVDAELAPAPGPAFEREVWARLAPHLPASRGSWRSRLLAQTRMPQWAFAAGVAALVLVAFLAGRLSTIPPTPTVVAGDADTVSERILVVAVVDHLDRSEMVLIELLNADLDASTDIGREPVISPDRIEQRRRRHRRRARRTRARAGRDR